MATSLAYSVQSETKGTAVDSVNATIESMVTRLNELAHFACRISDGLIGSSPDVESSGLAGPCPVSKSTQDHLGDLEAAVTRLSMQINRLG